MIVLDLIDVINLLISKMDLSSPLKLSGIIKRSTRNVYMQYYARKAPTHWYIRKIN